MNIENVNANINKVKEIISEKGFLAYTLVHGCAQNEADMEKMRGMLEEMGYGFTDSMDKADIIVMNTCAVREGAELTIYGDVGKFKIHKKNNPELVTVVFGCMMQQESAAEKLKKSYPYVDIVFGTHSLADFPEMLYKKLKYKKRVFDIKKEDEEMINLPVKHKDGVSFSVTVMQGCNNFCSYCIVPYVRGRERSFKSEDILKEISCMAEKGYSEVTLLGQNVNSYGKGCDISFAELLRRANETDGIKRIRFLTSHPKDLSDDLICAMAECEKVCKFLHLPFQAGSTKILEAMNRRYTKEQYLALVEKIRAKIPDIALSTDIIVGFPGETNEDFEDTMDVIEKVRFDSIFSFIYSRRSGTPAAEMEDVLPQEQIHENFDRLLERQKQIGLEKNMKYDGKTVEILVEGRSKTNPEILTGRTESNKLIHFKGSDDLIGKYINVKITKVLTFYMLAERI